jgi:hypothetical protein
VLVDADFLDYNTLGTNLKVWGDDAGGPHGQWSSSVYHRCTITDLYDYKLPLLSKRYAEIWKVLSLTPVDIGEYLFGSAEQDQTISLSTSSVQVVGMSYRSSALPPGCPFPH